KVYACFIRVAAPLRRRLASFKRRLPRKSASARADTAGFGRKTERDWRDGLNESRRTCHARDVIGIGFFLCRPPHHGPSSVKTVQSSAPQKIWIATSIRPQRETGAQWRLSKKRYHFCLLLLELIECRLSRSSKRTGCSSPRSLRRARCWYGRW